MTQPETRPCPPSWLARLLALLLPPGDRSVMVADMAELYARRRLSQSRLVADRWYAVQAARLVYSLRREQRRNAPSREGLLSMTGLGTDARLAARQLKRAPAFALGVILTAACAIGAATAMFSVLYGILFAPLPLPGADRLALLGERNGERAVSVAYPNFLDWQSRSRRFEAMAALQFARPTMRADGVSSELRVYRVSPGFFDVVGVGPSIGRTFTAVESGPAGPPVVVISHATWQTALAGDPGAVGSTVSINEQPHTVIGVMPPGFDFFIDGGAWIPIGPQVPGSELESRSTHAGTRVIGRLSPGATVADAVAEMDEIARQLAAEYPATNADASVTVTGLREYFVGDVRGALRALAGGVVALLLIGALNAANFVGTRLVARSSEFGIRAALGASPWRLGRQLLIEGQVYALFAGLVGLGLAQFLIRGLVIFDPGNLPRVEAVAIDGTAALFALALAAACGLAFGLVPVLAPSVHRPSAALGASRRQTVGATALRWRQVLLVAQVAIALVLLTAGGLMVRTLGGLTSIDPGFDPTGVLAVATGSPQRGDSDPLRFERELLPRIESLPGVISAAVVNPLPLGGSDRQNRFWIEGRPYASPDDLVSLDYAVIAGRYFETLQIPVVAGRAFDSREENDPATAIVDEVFAATFFPDRSPLGLTLQGGGPDSSNPRLTIVGVVGSIRHYGIAEVPRPQVYLSQNLFSLSGTLVVRAENPLAIGPSVRAIVQDVDAGVPVSSMRPFAELAERSIARERFAAFALTVFAALALGLAGVGIYATVAYDVAQRRREIGVRLALGATASSVFRAVLSRALVVVALGVVAGSVAALWTTRLIEGLLYDVSLGDPATHVAGAAVVAVAGLVGAAVPALRVARIAPLEALRSD